MPLTVIMIGYHMPPYTSDDHYALSVLSTIMGPGDSSRLNRLLVNSEKPLCVARDSTHWQAEDSGMVGVGGTVMVGKDPDQVRKILEDAIADVAKNGVTQEELDKAKTILKVGLIHGRETADDLASQLGEEYALRQGHQSRQYRRWRRSKRSRRRISSRSRRSISSPSDRQR